MACRGVFEAKLAGVAHPMGGSPVTMAHWEMQASASSSGRFKQFLPGEFPGFEGK
jgi:hypothetical protein